MKKFNYQSYGSHAGRMNNGGDKFRRIALFPLMLLMLLLLPTRMVAQTANGNTSNQAYAEFEKSTGTFTFKCGPKPAGAYDLNEGENLPSWYAQRDKIKTVVFDASFANARPTSCYRWFCYCYNLTTIEGIEYLNTEKVTNMKDMFYRCSALTSLDLSNFNTAEVKDMTEMFCSCSALTTIFVSDKFVTGQVTSSVDMFSGCDKLIGAIKYVEKNTNNKDYANYETGYFAPEGGFPGYAVFDGGTGTLTFRSGPSTSKPERAYDLNVGTSLPGWLAQRENIKTVVFDASFANARLTNCYAWFYGCNNLTTIEGIEYLNTENVTNMGGMFYNCCALTSLNLTSFNTAKVESMSCMFYNCSALTSLDLSNFNTAKVTNMEEMFIGCSALTTIYVSDKFVTDKVTDSRNMFSGCNKLIGAIEYDGSKSDHTYANYDNGYFSPEGGFHAYAEFNNATGTLTFSRGLSKPVGAYDLNEGDVQPAWSNQSAKINKVVFDASFANARPTSCYMWFYRCENLTKIEDIENLNTQNVTDMSWMFYRCDGLTSLDVSHFNTQKVEDMSEMFSVCSGLKSLNVSHFDTQNVKDMNSMFYSCERLTSLYVSDKFVTTKVSYGTDMFSGCTSLKGAIDFDDSKTDKTYANYKTGYFTKLVGKNGNDKIGAVGEVLTAESLALADDKDFEAYEPFAAKAASYSRKIKEGTTWGTLCLPFAIDQSKETGCKFYRLTGIDNECITLESYEEGIIPAGTPVLFKMNENEQTLSISTKDASIVKEPVAGTNTDVNLVGSFTKIGGNGNQGLAEYDYIIGKDKFWRVSDLNDGNGVGIKPMRAYIHPATASQARAAMLSIGKGDGTTAIDNLNAISNDANAEYYDANGRRTNGLQKGLNIVKRGSKTYKIMVK